MVILYVLRPEVSAPEEIYMLDVD